MHIQVVKSSFGLNLNSNIFCYLGSFSCPVAHGVRSPKWNLHPERWLPHCSGAKYYLD